MPVCASMSRPSKSFFRMKLTTPAMASGPYTAEAPPVMTSTPWIAAAGMVLMSTTSSAFAGCGRRPSTQHEIAVRAEAAQVQGRGAGRLRGTCLSAGNELVAAGYELRQLLQHRFDRGSR